MSETKRDERSRPDEATAENVPVVDAEEMESVAGGLIGLLLPAVQKVR